MACFMRLMLVAMASLLWLVAPASAHEKRIALTFDDVPRGAGAFLSPDERTQMLIAGLRESGVDQAAFFLNPGRIADRRGGLVHIAAYVRAGHVIANHTFTHPRLSQTPLDEFLADLDRASEWFEGRDGYRPWFRFPYLDEGRADAELRDAMRTGLAERGLINGYVTVDASDWFYEQATIDAVREGKRMNMAALHDLYVQVHVEAAEFNYQLAIDSVGYSPVHVMLLHETDLAALFIVQLVAGLRDTGWQIVTADEAYADPFGAFAATYDTPSAQGTLTEQVAWERGLPAPRWYEGNNTTLAEQWFRTRVLGEEEQTEQ